MTHPENADSAPHDHDQDPDAVPQLVITSGRQPRANELTRFRRSRAALHLRLPARVRRSLATLILTA
jgi:hypothetical protein